MGPAERDSRRTAFVLTGGGSLGAVQVGMMSALHERGIDPDVLVGTSVGAVNAAYLAGPGSTGGRLSSLGDLWSGIRRRDVFVLDPRRCLRATVGSAPSMFSGRPLRQLLEKHLGYQAFEGARLGLAVTATDVVTGAGLLLHTGPVVDAVAASSAVPGLLPPVHRAGRALVDGAVGRAGALASVDDCGVDDIYLIPAGYPCAGPRPTSALGVALTALNLMLHRQLVEEVQAYAGRARLRVVPPLCPLATSPADFTHGRALMLRALGSTREWLDQPAPPPSDAGPTGGRVLAFHPRHSQGNTVRPAPTTRRTAAPMKGHDA